MNIMPGPERKDTSATQDCYLRLQELILTGAVTPGQKLKIEDLRNRFETGASPVREALSLLTSDMLVERIDQRGFRAAPVSKANFNEILMLRCVMEETALRAAISRMTPDWEERLVLAHHRLARADRADVVSFEKIHKDFHMTLLDHAGLPLLTRYCAQLYDLNIRYRYLAADTPRYGERDIGAEHTEILNATLEQDADAAVSLLISHYRRTGEYLISQMED